MFQKYINIYKNRNVKFSEICEEGRGGEIIFLRQHKYGKGNDSVEKSNTHSPITLLYYSGQDVKIRHSHIRDKHIQNGPINANNEKYSPATAVKCLSFISYT